MKKNLILRFTIFYFISVGFTWSLNSITGFLLGFESILILSFIISFYLILFIIDSRINNNEDLTKANYWQLKNEFKKRFNGKEKKNGGKQVL